MEHSRPAARHLGEVIADKIARWGLRLWWQENAALRLLHARRRKTNRGNDAGGQVMRYLVTVRCEGGEQVLIRLFDARESAEAQAIVLCELLRADILRCRLQAIAESQYCDIGEPVAVQVVAIGEDGYPAGIRGFA